MHPVRPLVICLLIITVLLAACTAPTPQAPSGSAVVTGPTTASNPSSPEPTSSLAAEGLPAADMPSSTAEMVPLKDALTDLQPQAVFQNFYDLTQVPRPSGSMDKIRAFLVDFGKGLGLETIVDEAGNVIIRKPGATGLEHKPSIVLQAHMDMVAQKDANKDFDFTTDPIEAFVSGDTIVTDGTTLGADDGIGIAMIMAVLQSKDLKIGPVEALFTVDEESSMSGANGLDPATLKGRTLINLDGEAEGTFTIGSAGGERVNINSNYEQIPAPTDMISYLVKVQGLQGGHSGVDINEGFGHATKLLVRLLKEATEPHGLRLASIVGGTVANAIPREAEAIVFLADDQVGPFTDFVKQYETTIRAELAATEPDLSVVVEAVQPPAEVMGEDFQKTVINALYATPQGVIRMSDTVPDLVETSNNLGITTVQDGQMQVICNPRSSVDSELQDVAQMIASVWELAGYPVEITGWYSAWTPDITSPILNLMETTYTDLYSQEAVIEAVHAGLECGAIGGIYPDMDMISIGPNLSKVHSPSENLFIPSVEKVMELLEETLQKFAGQ